MRFDDNTHFKFGWMGETRRFILNNSLPNMLSEVRKRVVAAVGNENVKMTWHDGASANVLESEEDMKAALDFTDSIENPYNVIPYVAIWLFPTASPANLDGISSLTQEFNQLTTDGSASIERNQEVLSNSNEDRERNIEKKEEEMKRREEEVEKREGILAMREDKFE
ncbi:hypothetical protein PFISCL1PPCAC_1634, partial [Pristionchus fissidentatus]